MTTKPSYRILLLDDSPEDRATYCRYLQRDQEHDYEILEADSATIALEMCQELLPDLILLDYQLPDMDGLALWQLLVQQLGEETMPVLMVTGQGNEAIAVQSIKQGIQDYLVKSNLTAEGLRKTVIHTIGQFQLQKQLREQHQKQQLVTEITLKIRQSLNLQTILQTTVDEIRQLLQVDRVIIFQFSQNWGGTIVVESVRDESLAILPFNIYDPCIGEAYVEPFKQGLVTAKADIYHADISPCHVEFLERLQVKANLVVPIPKNDQLWGLLAAHHCTAPRQWQETEIELLRQLSSQFSIALQQAALLAQVQAELSKHQQMEEALRSAKEDLENRIVERTEELQIVNARLQQQLLQQIQIEQELRQSEARYRGIVEDQTELIGRFTSDNIVLFVNEAYCRYFNLRPEEIIGKTYTPVIYPADQAKVAELVRSITLENPIVMCENRVINGRGEIRWTQWVNRFLLNTDDNLIEIQCVGRDITELKQIEQALQNSEESRRLALDLSHLGFWDWDFLNNTLVWNDNHFQLLGLEAYSVEPSYELYCSRLHPDDLSLAQRQFRESVETHTNYAAEYRVIHPDNSVHWLMARGKALYDDAGQPVRSLGMVIDVTDRKLAEQKIQQQAQQERLRREITQRIRQSLDLQTIFNTACQEVRQVLQADRVGIFKFYPESNFDDGEFVAESAVSGLTSVIGIGVHDHCFGEKYAPLYAQGHYCAIDDIYHHDLEGCHIEVLSQFQVWSNLVIPLLCGETLWGLLCIHQCFSPRHWHQSEIDLAQQLANQLAIAIQQSELYHQLQTELQERKQKEAILREAERRWRSLLDNVQLLVVELDLSGNINYVNPFFLSLTGYSQLEVLGKNWFENFLPVSHQVLLKNAFAEVLSDRVHPYYQNAILTKSGEERFIAWNNTVLQDSQENTIGSISIGEDITERQKIEKIKDEFIGIVSHELRTPLTGIQMSLGLLQTGIYAQKPEKSKRMLEIAFADTNRLVNLVNDILDLERLESGRAILEKTVCQAMDLMQQSVDGMQAIATQQEIQLTIVPTNATVWAAPNTIIQTLTNLLSNALKFSPAHSSIYLQAETEANYILFQVRDQGRGIPEDKLETIFGRFQQVDASDSREKGGTGLGLPICRSIIEKHGGKIWAESIVGVGSTFFFTLPIPDKNSL
ncbi:MAG: PAS domain S-box protein [Snowella sp.]|nr:PAS domain S-box protein [Snowella sp.]